MRRTTRIAAAAALAASLAASPPAAAQASGAFVAGRWAGRADLGEGMEDVVVRVVEAGDGAAADGVEARGGSGSRLAIALVDLPARSLFGYPAEDFRRDAEGMSFSISAAGPAGGFFSFRGSPSKRDEGESFAVEGEALYAPGGAAGGAAGGADGDGAAGGEAFAGASEPHRGRFLFSLSSEAGSGEPYSIAVDGGRLAGSLVLPGSARGWNVPVALILPGAGEADRDGDNYNVPGKAGALALLARELASRGVASLRYDKRGVGESLASAPADPSFDDYVEDATCALRDLAADPRFSRIVVVGHAEGALVGAAAAARAEASLGGRLRGAAALCASGLTAARILRRDLGLSIEEGFPDLTDEERGALAAEAMAIVDSLERGEPRPAPREELASFFDPAAQEYYASALRYDIGAELASISVPVLVVAGGSDLQVPPAEAAILLEARPDAAYRVIRGMSHALKDVGDDEEANYDSFADPAYPLGAGLADLVAAFARGEALPGEGATRP